MQEVMHDIADGFLKAFLEFLEVLLVEEDLVFVVGERAVPLQAALAFRDGKVKIVVALGGLYVKKIGALTGANRFGVNIVRIPLLSVRTLVIFTVHTCAVFVFSVHKFREII